MVIRTAPALVLLLLAGCATVGPDYKVPEQALVNSPDAQGEFVSGAGVARGTPLPDRWWHLFDDPVLDKLIAEALSKNTDLRIAQANLERQHGLLAEMRAAQDLEFGADLQTSFTQASAAAVLKSVRPPDHPVYDLGLSVSYDLDLFGRLRRGIEAAAADDEAAEAARDLVRINIAAEMARAYADLCNSGEQIQQLEALLAVQQEAVTITKRLVAHGRLPELDLERQQVTIESSQARLPELSALQRNAAYRIATLMGQVPTHFDPALLTCHTSMKLEALVPVGNGRELLRRRPDLRAAERRLAASVARIGVAIAGFYPDIRLGASIGSTGPTAIALSPLTNRFSIGPSVSWTLQHDPVRARVEQAEAQSRASLAAFDGAVLAALREVEGALNRYGSNLASLEDLRAAHRHAESVAKQSRTLRNSGRLSPLAALESERDFARTDMAIGAAESALNQTQIRLFLELGGGWQEATSLPGAE